MLERTSVAVAGLSLVISIVTAWLTLFRRGTLRMTQPAFVFFGPDGGDGRPKVATCTHLYSTADRGRIIESFYLRLTHNGISHDFDVWVYDSGGLARGSGAYVGRDGITCSHHFLLPKAADSFAFIAGTYEVGFFASVVGGRGPVRLFNITLQVPDEAARAICEEDAGLFFEWRPGSRTYELSVDRKDERIRRQLRKISPMLAESSGGPVSPLAS